MYYTLHSSRNRHTKLHRLCAQSLQRKSCCLCVIFLRCLFVSTVCMCVCLWACASGCREFKKKNHTHTKHIFAPGQFIENSGPARLDSGEMEFKTKLKVYHRLAALASDKNDQSERQICLDSRTGMKIARRIRLPWRFQRSGHHAGRAADAHVHPFIHGSQACHRADFKGRVWARAAATSRAKTNNLATSHGGG